MNYFLFSIGDGRRYKSMSAIRIAVVLLMVLANSGRGQGFINFNFESAQIVSITSGALFGPTSITTTNAVPGWAVFLGTNQLTQLNYNSPALGMTFVTLLATNGLQINGNFSLLLQGGLTESSATISQSALVPATAHSLTFEAQPGLGDLSVSLGGQNLVIQTLSVFSNHTLYGADVSSFAGQVTTLSFSAIRNISVPNNWNIDNIQFSNTAVPEPSTLALAGLGAVAIGLRRLKSC